MNYLLKTTSLFLAAIALVGCQKPSNSGTAMSDFDAKASVILTQFAREVSQARGYVPPREGGARGNARSFSNPFGQQGGTGQFGLNNFTYPQNIDEKMQQCLNPSLNTPLTHADTRMMAGKLAQCVQSSIATGGNPVSSYGTNNLSPYSAETYAYLVNYQGNGALPGTQNFNGFGNGIFNGMGLNTPNPQQQCGFAQSPFSPQCFGAFGNTQNGGSANPFN